MYSSVCSPGVSANCANRFRSLTTSGSASCSAGRMVFHACAGTPVSAENAAVHPAASAQRSSSTHAPAEAHTRVTNASGASFTTCAVQPAAVR
jgi:hypothetical protein